MTHIIDGMKRHHVQRLITIGTAGILQSRLMPDQYRFESAESKRKSTRAAKEHRKAILFEPVNSGSISVRKVGGTDDRPVKILCQQHLVYAGVFFCGSC